MNDKLRKIVFGLCFLIVGIGYLGDLGMLWHFTIFFPGWWTLALIVPSVWNICEQGVNFGNIFFLLCGVYLLADANGWIRFDLSFQLVGALACVGFGIWMLVEGMRS